MPTPTTRPRPPPWRSLDFDAIAPTLTTDVLLATYANVSAEHDRCPDARGYELAALCAARAVLAREIADRATGAMRARGTATRRAAA